MTTSRVRSRAFVFVMNNPTPALRQLIDSLDCRYMIYGCEIAPTTGTPHLQGYVAFEHPREQRSVVKDLPGCWCEPARGTVDDNEEYSTKEGREIVERGEKPLSKREQGQREKRRWADAFALAKTGDLDAVGELDPHIALVYAHQLRTIASEAPQRPPALDGVCGVWFHGLPGVGKSRRAEAENPGYFDKSLDQWWDGYSGETAVIMDEFRREHANLAGAIIKWADYRPFKAAIKGSTKWIRPQRFIVTSNYLPAQIWCDPITVAAITRRFQFILVE